MADGGGATTKIEKPLTLDQQAERLLRPWWDWWKTNQPARLPAQSYINCKQIVRGCLANEKPARLIVAGMNLLAQQGRSVSGGTLGTAMTEAADSPNAPVEFHPYRSAASNSNGGSRPPRTPHNVHIAGNHHEVTAKIMAASTCVDMDSILAGGAG